MIVNPEQTMLRETVSQFFGEHAPISELRALAQRSVSESYDKGLWTAMVDLGLTGVTVPAEFDGLEFGWMGLGAVAQEAGRHMVSSPLLSSVVMAQNLLLNCGSRAQITTYLPRLLSGEVTGCVAIDEGRFYDPASLALADVNGGVSGTKVRVLNAASCELIFCVARQSTGQMGVAVIPVSAAGLHIEPKRAMDLHGHATLTLNGVSPDAIEWLEGDSVEAGVTATLDQATLVLSAEMLGSAREALERTINYLGEREQFDVKLGTFQALQHRCATMYCELELAESAVCAGLTALDGGVGEVSLLASAAKALANDCFTVISSEAVQLHGGMGVTEEMDMGLFLKRSRVCNEQLGSSSYHRRRYAQLSGF